MPDYPSELEEILLRSLSKPLDERYESAADMQKALDGLPAALRSSTEEELADFMQGLLTERMEKRKSLIQHALKAADERAEGRKSRMSAVDLSDERSGTLSGVGRLSNVDGVPSVRGVDNEQSTSAVATAVSAQTAPKSKTPAVLGALAVGVAAALGVYAMTSRPSEEPAPAAQAAQPIQAPAEPEPEASAAKPEKAEVLQVGDLKEAEEIVPEVVQEIDLDAMEEPGTTAKRAPRRRAPKPTIPAKAAPAPAPAPAAAEAPKPAPAPTPKAGKPFISPFADPDF